ncbi:MAG: DedA family protein [Firmicutes bacterium]|nr:DedA family protein [Bacillota bacterium]
MSDYISVLIEYFRQYHIAILGLTIVLQNNGVPLGSNFLVMAAGAFAFSGEFSLYTLGGQVLFFSLLGDSVSYLLWRKAGLGLLDRYPRLDRRIRPGLGRVEEHFQVRGGVTVLFSRFPLSALNPVVNITAGLGRYRYVPFIVIAAVGEVLWGGFNLGVGYWFGEEWEQIAGLLSQFGQIILMAVLLAVMVYAVIKLLKNRSARHHAEEKEYYEDINA